MITEPLLKTQQVAAALGVSVSTVKRWVDSGVLRATRTIGRHRLIPLAEALRVAREQSLPVTRLERMGSVSVRSIKVKRIDELTLDALMTALRRGCAQEARDLILSGYAVCNSAVTLGDQLIRPAMERIGHDWHTGALDVYQEHRATRIVESALMDLVQQLIRSNGRSAGVSAPLALGASPEGDPYTIPGLLCEMALRELGWDVTNLGPNLPMASLAKAVRAQQPRLVWLSVSHLADLERFVGEYASFYEVASMTGAAVILGGQALDSALRARLVAASFGERVVHLVEFARRVAPSPVVTPLPQTDRPETDLTA